MTKVFGGTVRVDSHNWFVMGDNIAGPMNMQGFGLSVEDDHLWLNTGTSMGDVPVVINVLDAAATEGGDWDESHDGEVTVTQQSLNVVGGMLEIEGTFAVAPGRYHVRYSAKGNRQAWDRLASDEEPALDRYQLDFWPV